MIHNLISLAHIYTQNESLNKTQIPHLFSLLLFFSYTYLGKLLYKTTHHACSRRRPHRGLVLARASDRATLPTCPKVSHSQLFSSLVVPTARMLNLSNFRIC